MRKLAGLLIGIALVLGPPPSSALDLEWVAIGDPGNAPDETGFGTVADTYRIGRFEVSNAEYAEFLNAVAAVDDTHGLWDASMAGGNGGITRSQLGNGTFQYDPILGRQDWPVNWVTFWDAARFANWLHNGQPVGMQDSTTTEDGAYDIESGAFLLRQPDAQFFLPSEDEWYKAAYFDGASYFDYPAGSDVQTTCDAPGPTPNSANCDFFFTGGPVTTGGYTGSPSPYGTFDQGGNVWEWNEDLSGPNRILRGGAFSSGSHHDLAASSGTPADPESAGGPVGFRIAPEPGAAASLVSGGLLLALLRRWRAYAP